MKRHPGHHRPVAGQGARPPAADADPVCARGPHREPERTRERTRRPARGRQLPRPQACRAPLPEAGQGEPRRGAVEHYYTAIAGPHITDAAWGVDPDNRQAGDDQHGARRHRAPVRRRGLHRRVRGSPVPHLPQPADPRSGGLGRHRQGVRRAARQDQSDRGGERQAPCSRGTTPASGGPRPC